MTEHQVQFCPFCRDGFEGRATCPTHELSLVPHERLALPPDAEDASDDDIDAPAAYDEGAPLAWHDPSGGRGPVAIAALLLGLALPLGLLRAGTVTLPTYAVAVRLPSLWTWLLVSFCVLYLLCRRRSPRALRGLRVVVPWLGCVALLTLGLAMARLGSDVRGPAVYAAALGGVLLVAFGLRLGRVSTRA